MINDLTGRPKLTENTRSEILCQLASSPFAMIAARTDQLDVPFGDSCFEQRGHDDWQDRLDGGSGACGIVKADGDSHPRPREFQQRWAIVWIGQRSAN